MENFETLQNVELEPCTSVDYDPLAIGVVKIEPINGYNESDDRDASDTSCNVFQDVEHLMTAKRPKEEFAYFKHPSRGSADVNRRPYERSLSVQAGKQQGSQSKLRRIVSDEGRKMEISRKYSHNDVREHAICLKLIELVKANPVIWSESSKHYLDANLKTAAWRQIALEMRATVEMVKRKWSSLCAYFRKESSRLDNPNITESGRSDVYPSNWYAYESMQFIKEAANPRPTKSTDAGEKVHAVKVERWPTHQTIKFLREVKNHECLYNVKSSDYNSRRKRLEAWRDVISNMDLEGFGIKDAKKKFHTLQTVFSKEVARMKASSGPDAKAYISAIQWLGEMQPLVKTSKNADLLDLPFVFHARVKFNRVKPVRWATDKTIRFLREVKNHECLYNVKSSDYNNRHKRLEAWRVVTSNMDLEGFGIKDAKNKFHTLQTVFSKEMSRMKASSGLGAKAYVSAIQWLGEMQPLVSTSKNEDQLDHPSVGKAGVKRVNKNRGKIERWPTDRTLRFLGEIKNHECLYNVTSSDYKNRRKRLEAWRVVASNMDLEGFGIKDAKKKFHIFQTVFNKEMSRMKASSGPGDTAYVSSIRWLGEMEALVSTSKNEDFLEKIEISGNQDDSYIAYSPEAEPATPTVEQDTANNTNVERQVKKDKNDVPLEAVNHLKNVSDSISNRNKLNENFSEYISLELQELPETRQFEVRQKIFNLVAEARLKDVCYSSERNVNSTEELELLRKENEYLTEENNKLQKRCQELEEDYDKLTTKFCQLECGIEVLDE